MPTGTPIQLALLNDHPLVVNGLAQMLDTFDDRVQVVDVSVSSAPGERVDVVLYDTFATDIEQTHWSQLIGDGWEPQHIVYYCWEPATASLNADQADGARPLQVSKTLDGEALVSALEQIIATGTYQAVPEAAATSEGRDWPGRREGLNERESEILVLIVAGYTNEEIAKTLYLGINTIKTYIRSAYRTMGVTDRVHAVLWGVDHGFRTRQSAD